MRLLGDPLRFVRFQEPVDVRDHMPFGSSSYFEDATGEDENWQLEWPLGMPGSESQASSGFRAEGVPGSLESLSCTRRNGSGGKTNGIPSWGR